jgi:DNA-binding IclR family transcriptional regulator
MSRRANAPIDPAPEANSDSAIDETQRYSIRAIERAMRILMGFTTTDKELTIAALAAEAGVPRSTAFRILATLEATGFVERGSIADTFRLGPSALLLGGAALRQLDFQQRLRPQLEALMQATGETVHLVVFRDHQTLVVDKIDSYHAIRLVSNIGFSSPLHATAAGKLMLAYQPQPRIDYILSDYHFTPYTPATITDADALRRHLAQIRQQGYAQDEEEFESGLRCVAAPVRDSTCEVCAGVSVSGPSQRMSDEKVAALIPLLLEHTNQMSRTLGYPGDTVSRNGSLPHHGARRDGETETNK